MHAILNPPFPSPDLRRRACCIAAAEASQSRCQRTLCCVLRTVKLILTRTSARVVSRLWRTHDYKACSNQLLCWPKACSGPACICRGRQRQIAIDVTAAALAEPGSDKTNVRVDQLELQPLRILVARLVAFALLEFCCCMLCETFHQRQNDDQ